MTQATTPLLDRMAAQTRRWEQADDRRAIFLACYAMMTRNMQRGLADGRFADAAWVDALVERFASYYFVSLQAYEAGAAAQLEVWRRAHDLARLPTTTAIQNLLMGVNAHINCDLVLVLDDLLTPVWGALSERERALRHADYTMVNTIIGETIDRVQDEVIAPYARGMGLVDRLWGPLDEWCTAQLIRNWRADVWRRALAIVAAESAEARGALRAEADVIALRRIGLLIEGGAIGARVFGYPLRYLHRLKIL